MGRSGGGSAGPQPGVAHCALENVSRTARGASSPCLNPRFLAFSSTRRPRCSIRRDMQGTRRAAITLRVEIKLQA